MTKREREYIAGRKFVKRNGNKEWAKQFVKGLYKSKIEKIAPIMEDYFSITKKRLQLRKVNPMSPEQMAALFNYEHTDAKMEILDNQYVGKTVMVTIKKENYHG
jgi:hypothetical protein